MTYARRGFSLLELLVAVAIIGLLLALVIPAVAKVRNLARRTGNQNNIRQIMLAVNTFANNNNGSFSAKSGGVEFPGYGYNLTNCASTVQTGPKTWTTTGCPGLLSGSTLTMKQGGAYDVVYTQSSSQSRTDWIDGGLMFRILPFLGHSDVWDSSYGPFQDDKLTPGEPVLNSGFAANNVRSRIKVYLGYGDPSLLNPALEAPLSYFRLNSSYTEHMDSINPSYSAYLVEAYSSCYHRNSDQSNPASRSTSYYSWVGPTRSVKNQQHLVTAGAIFPGCWPVTTSSGGAQSITARKWLGITGDGTPGSTVALNSLPQAYDWDPRYNWKYNRWVNDQIVGQIPGVTTYSDGYNILPDPRGEFWNDVDFSTVMQVPPSISTPEQRAALHCEKAPSADLPECHPAEWYSLYTFEATRRTGFFEDHPMGKETCTSAGAGNENTLEDGTYSNYGGWSRNERGRVQSLVPGSINVGMMDGSIKVFTDEMDGRVWWALLKGEAPTADW